MDCPELKEIGWFSSADIDAIVEEVRKLAETVSIGLRLPSSVLDYIEKEARRENLDRSAIIRRLMERGKRNSGRKGRRRSTGRGRYPSAARRM